MNITLINGLEKVYMVRDIKAIEIIYTFSSPFKYSFLT
jgi:hypothetical protein